MRSIYAVCGFTVFSLVGCGGSSDSDASAPGTQAPPIVNAPTVFTGSLVQAGASSFEQYIKNGIYSAATTSFAPVLEDGVEFSVGGAGGFSTTNVQEAGVDEADRMEYDGNYLYIAAHPQWQDETFTPAHVRILKRNEDFSLSEIALHNLTDEQFSVTGMYLSNDKLSILSSGSPMASLAEVSTFPYGGGGSAVELSLLNVSSPANPVVDTTISIEGWLLSSRRIGNQLYLVTAFSPFVEGVQLGEATDEQKIASYNRISSTAMTDLMPQMTIDGQVQPLNSAEECFMPEAATQQDGFNQILSVTRVNIEDSQNFESVCLSAMGDLVYASQDNLYLTGGRENSTAIHKINLGSDLNYAASGTVPGVLGWQVQGQLRLDEHNGFLRIVSSDYQEESPVHQLSILQQQGDELEIVASLPNSEQTEVIGKPGEDIFAVRFVDERAYVVTFERVDPLYVIDLANNLQPSIAGSLEIPGFSNYLHPLEGGYLLGVGQQVNVSNIPAGSTAGTDPNQTTSPVEPVVSEGMKLSLFNISDPASPIEVKSIVKESTYTPVEYDYRALSVLKQGDKYQFAFPLEQWLGSDDGAGNIFWQSSSSLMMLDVDTLNGSMDELGQMHADTGGSYIFSGADRSVIHGEHVYYIRGNDVWHGLWQADTEINGPY